METIYPIDLIEKLQAVNVEEIIAQSITESKQDFTALQSDQLYAGKRSDDTDIEPEYSASTRRHKKSKGQPYDRVTTRDTGKYHAGLDVKVKGDDLEIGSDVPYEQYLDKRYGKKLYGLTAERTEAYAFGPFWSVLKTKFESLTTLIIE